jgi:hypothetical protein
MTFTLSIISETGDTLAMLNDPHGAFQDSLPRLGDHRFRCLAFVDPYGATIFNPTQVEVLVEELESGLGASPTASRAAMTDTISFARRVIEMARKGDPVLLRIDGD